MVRANLDKPRTINYKGFADLVTDTDEASEKAILEASARQPIALLPHWGLPGGGRPAPHTCRGCPGAIQHTRCPPLPVRAGYPRPVP